MRDKYITVWRKVDEVFEWDFHTSMGIEEARRVFNNLKDQGVKQCSTFPIGARVDELSITYGGNQ